MTILSLGKRPEGLVKFFRGDVPEKYESEFNLADTFSGYITTEDTSLNELCERNGYLKTALKNFIKNSISDVLRGKKRKAIKNLYKCADPDFFDKIVDLLIEEGGLEERNGQLYPPRERSRELVERELFPKLLSNSDKDAKEILNQSDKQQTWKNIGKEIIEEMEEKGSLATVDGKLRPYFFKDEILSIEYVDGKLKWSIQEDDRWEYWRNIFEEIAVCIGEFESSREFGFGEIDSSEISPGRYTLTASFSYVVEEEREEVSTQKKIELTEKEIIVPPKFKIYSSLKTDEQILEMDANPKILEKINLEMFELPAACLSSKFSGSKMIIPDDTLIVLSDINWVQKGGNSYAKIGEKTNFSLRVNGKDLSNWTEELSLRNFFENFLETPMREADAPGQNCECEMEADNVILELFDKDLGEMLDLYVNDEKVGIEEESEDRCFSAWKAKQREYRVQIKIDFKKGSLALKEKILRVPFPEPKIELVKVS